ncbi:hypothetical protein [Okeania sp.]|nr:hypothetical protein [Okeania sp.]
MKEVYFLDTSYTLAVGWVEERNPTVGFGWVSLSYRYAEDRSVQRSSR